MSTPCVCRGGLTPCCCAHTRGGRRGAKQRSNSPARTSTLHAKRGDVQATRRQGGMDRFCVRVRTPTPPPLGGGRPSYKSTPHTEPSSSKSKQRHRHARPNSHARPEPGRPSYKATCTTVQKQHEARGGREMRLGVMDRVGGVGG